MRALDENGDDVVFAAGGSYFDGRDAVLTGAAGAASSFFGVWFAVAPDAVRPLGIPVAVAVLYLAIGRLVLRGLATRDTSVVVGADSVTIHRGDGVVAVIDRSSFPSFALDRTGRRRGNLYFRNLPSNLRRLWGGTYAPFTRLASDRGIVGVYGVDDCTRAAAALVRHGWLQTRTSAIARVTAAADRPPASSSTDATSEEAANELRKPP